MYLLRHNNVDNDPSTWAKFDSKPTKVELVKVFFSYYDQATSEKAATELLANGEVDINDGSCTSFKLESV